MFILRIMAIAAAVAASLALGTPGVRAQAEGSPEALQAAEELFAVLSKDMLKQLSEQMTAQIWPMVEQQLHTTRPDIDAATITDLHREFVRIQLEYLADILKGAPALYAKYFTAPELRDMLTFYRTPTGEKSLRVLPQVMSEYIATMMPRLQEIESKAVEAFNKILRDRGYIK